MSLDVYLEIDEYFPVESRQIFIRENGQTKEISCEEWNKLHPDQEPVVVSSEETNCVYHSNITHNLTDMAEAAKIYTYLWHPERHGIKKAKELLPALKSGLLLLKEDQEKFKKYNPPNGWGDYECFVEFVQDYFDACRKWPEAEVKVWAQMYGVYYPNGGLGYIGVEEKDEYIYNDNGLEIRSEMIKAVK